MDKQNNPIYMDFYEYHYVKDIIGISLLKFIQDKLGLNYFDALDDVASSIEDNGMHENMNSVLVVPSFHIHSLCDTTNGCNSTGPHFNPLNKHHGAPANHHRHAGDLGNILAGPDGVAEISITDSQIPLSGVHSILGRAVVVHADPDDLGRGKIGQVVEHVNVIYSSFTP
ncbi:hypothetical protein Ahy_B06g081795 [Arachis hypogaea]|uniref:Superoxide dismutase copper/zinc binding domain-containing protein n=1 Tax=Arachis hypogaea TaxID=3818 RepID=A0A444YM13_ARAHY|nr:hypothetical protein Ahy_B06g081795 [Arachis hypogaea]